MEDLLSKSLDDIIREKGAEKKKTGKAKNPAREERTKKAAPFKREGAAAAPAGNSVFIGNLAFEVSEDTLRAHLSSAGTVVSASILKTSSGKSRGCALATFSDAAAADRAISALTDTELDGRKIFVREDREAAGGAGAAKAAKKPRGEITVVKASSQHAVTVRNLPRDITGEELRGIFASCGATGGSVTKKGGSGRVEFRSAAQAARAAADFNNALVNGQAISVTVV